MNTKRILCLVIAIMCMAFLTVSCGAPAAEEPVAEEPAAEAPAAEEPAPAADDTVNDAADAGQDAATTTAAPDDADKMEGMVIGVSVGDLRLERWKRDLDYMTAKAEQLGAEVYSNSADGDEQKQISQIENMLTKGIKVLLVIPVNSAVLAPIVEACHADNVKVIAYDRILENCDLDYYITFDMVEVGRIQAKFIHEKVPKGDYYLLNGPKEDNNAKMFRDGQMEILQPFIDSGDIKVVADQWAEGWLPEKAMACTEDALTQTDNKIDGIVCSNDSTCQGAIQALKEQGLAGKIPITGQDADLANCKSIVAGEQTMTVYKSLRSLAEDAIQLAYEVMTDKVRDITTTYPNGQKDVPSIFLPVQVTTKDNMMDTVIKDGFHSYDDVYADVPEADRPPKP